MNIISGLTFDDVLLVPQYSEIESRSNIDTSVKLSDKIELKIPLVSANMKTVTGVNMAAKIAERGGLAILHRFDSIENQICNYKEAVSRGIDFEKFIGVSVGVNSFDHSCKVLDETGANIVCIDVAHGDHKLAISMTEKIARKYTDILLISGNVATGHGAKRLADAGADIIKAGVGPGSLCSTRVETGNGVPQLTALDTINGMLRGSNVKIIADGGIKSAGDIVKALCFSDLVMIGSLLAGTDEAPGDIITGPSGKRYKEYAGSSTHKTSHIEGVAGLTQYKGLADDVIDKLLDGLKSGLSYQGCENTFQLQDNPLFVRISQAGLKESHPHAALVR